MERLSALDAEFLHLEDGAAHMHIGGACVFRDPPPSIGEFEALIGAKLHLIPRYRQRVRTVPLELGRPIWADDPHFDLGSHIHRAALPAPGDDAIFRQLMGRLMSQSLDRNSPLWELWLVEGLEGGRWALVCKVHHCMVDGIAGVGLLTIVLDVDAGTAVGVPEPWAPRPEPSGTAKVLDAWDGLVSSSAALGRQGASSLVHPLDAVRSAVEIAGGALHFLAHLVPTRRLSIEGPIGPHRVWAHSNVDLADVTAVRRAFGGTVNDVVLAAMAGGYRRLLLEHGDDADRAVLRSLVPVSTRHDDGRGIPDNRLSALIYELPVRVTDPLERLEVVQRELAALKAEHLTDAGEVVTEAGNFVPPVLLGALTRCVVRSMHRFGQQSLNTVTTNVPGPGLPLYCLGREMLAYLPFVPISHGFRVGTAALSYNGQLFFGVTGDESVPDVGVVATEAATGIEALRDLAVARFGDHPTPLISRGRGRRNARSAG